MTLKGHQFNYRTRQDQHKLINDDRLYVDIRIAGKAKTKHEGKTIDVSIYLETGERLKVSANNWDGSQVRSGYDKNPQKSLDINIRLNDLLGRVMKYKEANPNATKQLIEENVYGKESLAAWKKKRIQYRDILVNKVVETDRFKELRKTNGKKKIITTEPVSTVENDFEVIRHVEKETVIDPLSLEDFPKNFSPAIYEYYKEQTLATEHYVRSWERLGKKEGILNSMIKELVKRDLFAKEKEVVRIDKNVLNEFEKRKKKGEIKTLFNVSEIKNEDVRKSAIEFEESAQLIKIDAELKTKKQVRKDGFDKSDLFEVFVSGFDLEHPNQINKPGILWRLIEYKFKAKPSSKVSDFTVDWCKKFLTHIFTQGVKSGNFRDLKPKDATAKDFVGEKIYYHPDNYKDIIKWFKDAIKKLTAVKRLPKIDLDEINAKEFLTKEQIKEVDETPQDEKGVTKVEFDKLFHFDFKNHELSLTRDRFILMVMFGGLRVNEFRPDKIQTGGSLHIDDDGYGGKIVRYYTSHQQKLREMANPITEYADSILKKYDYKIPFYKDGRGKATSVDEQHYNKSLKEMAKATGLFKRLVKDKVRIKGKLTKVRVPIENDFTSLYARHSIYRIFKYKDMPHEQVMLFAGHSGKKDSSSHYDSKYFKDHAHKRKQIEKYGIKPEL